MVYNPCPDGFKLVGGVCVPQSNEALMKWKSRQGKKRQPQPEPEPEPDIDPDTPEPDVDPDTPEPDVDPDTPEPDVEPDNEPDAREDFQKVDPTGMSQGEIAALLVSAGMVASGSAVRAVALGGLNIFTGSAGSTVAATSSGVGMGFAEGATGIGVGAEGVEMTSFSVLSPANQAATDALLSGDASITETTPLLEDAAGEGIEMSGGEVIGGGTESAAAATADEGASLISGAGEAASAAAEAGEAGAAAAEGAAAAAEAGTAAAEAAGAAAEGAIIAAEGSAAVAGAAETLGTSLIVGGLVIAGTEAALHADEVEKGIDTAVVETGEFFEDVGKTLNPSNWF